MARNLEEAPIGVLLNQTNRIAERAFDRALQGSGGSRSWWVILRTLRHGQAETQSALADAVGLRGATLIHHLDALEKAGLVTRTRNRENRRLQAVSITREGRALFDQLLTRVIAYDEQLRAGLKPGEEAVLRKALSRMAGNFDPPASDRE